MRPVVRLTVLLVCLGLAPNLRAQSVALDSLQTARLATLGRVWGVVKYFHPAILSRPIDWDSALVATVPRALSARSDADYANAIDAMLGYLGDPNTHVRPNALSPPEVTGSSATARWSDSTLVIAIPRFKNDIYERVQGIVPLIRGARRVVFDLRGPPPSNRGDADDVFGNTLDGLLTARPISAPRIRYRMQRRYTNDRETYETGGELFRPSGNTVERRVAFVLYADSDLPLIAWALQESGDGGVVLDGGRGTLINSWSSRSATYAVDLGAGHFADIRLSDALGRANGLLTPDSIAHRDGTTDTPLHVALELVRRPARRPALTPSNVMLSAPGNDSAFAEMRYPQLPYRMLAAFRYWNAIHYFYPSEMPAGEDWDRALSQIAVTLAAARDSVEYAVAVWDMVRRLKDGHAGAPSPPIIRLRGEYWPSVGVEYVEGQPAIVRVGTDSAIRASGIKVGDVILRVDGEDVASRKARLAKYAPGTRPEVHDYRFAQNSMLSGPEGSTARVTVQSTGGVVHEVSLVRRVRPCLSPSCALRPGPAFRLLPGNIGYVDLSLLDDAAVDSMFNALRNTSAIIFDGRGYPRGTTFSLAARLATTAGVVLARGTFPINLSPDPNQRGLTTGAWVSQPTTKWRYTGRTAVLIDLLAQSQAEQIVLALAATGATLIGSPTGGALGSTTPVILPGGIRASFPSGEWHRADGTPLQRVGIQPDIAVRPTIAGIRAGRDEVLERAIEFVRGSRR
jgi:C-terminal processing protease CtpA/Prc